MKNIYLVLLLTVAFNATGAMWLFDPSFSQEYITESTTTVTNTIETSTLIEDGLLLAVIGDVSSTAETTADQSSTPISESLASTPASPTIEEPSSTPISESSAPPTTEEPSSTSIQSRVARDAGNSTGSADNSTVAAATCKAQALCYKDKDCGEKGRCLGIFVGKCNCNACLNLLTCTDNSACGGLRNACNTTTNRCDCFAGHKANGFPLFIDALRELCNVKDCDAKTDTCFGLPCNSGRCVC